VYVTYNKKVNIYVMRCLCWLMTTWLRTSPGMTMIPGWRGPWGSCPPSLASADRRAGGEGRSAYSIPQICQQKQLYLTVLLLKGTVSRDFLLLVFFMNQFPPKPLSIPLGPFRIFSKIRGDIRSSRLTTVINDTGDKFCHQFYKCCWYRWQTVG